MVCFTREYANKEREKEREKKKDGDKGRNQVSRLWLNRNPQISRTTSGERTSKARNDYLPFQITLLLLLVVVLVVPLSITAMDGVWIGIDLIMVIVKRTRGRRGGMVERKSEGKEGGSREETKQW